MPHKDPEVRRQYLLQWQRKMRANRTEEQKKQANHTTNEWKRKRYKEDPEYRNSCVLRSRLWRYGITEETYASLLESQNGLCALCSEPLYGSEGRSPVIDHCHNTGAVRAILHNNCNIAIGMLGDNAAKCRMAAKYLESFSEPRKGVSHVE